MARDGVMYLRGLRQMRFTKLTADTSSGVTYSSSPVLASAPKSVAFAPETYKDDLPAQDEKVDKFQKTLGATVTVVVGGRKMALQALLQGLSAAVDGGTTPNETKTLTVKSTDQPPYVKGEFRVAYLGSDEAGGDFLLMVAKMKLQDFSWSHGQDGYSELTLVFGAVPRTYDSVIYTETQNETATDLTESPDVTAPTLSSTTPASGATGVATSTTVVIVFSEAIQYDPNDFNLFVDTTGALVACNKALSAGDTTVTLTPQSALTGATAYRYPIPAVKDAAGNVLAAPSVRKFTTA